MNIPTIRTSRLQLRALRPGDAAALHCIYSEKTVRRYFPRPGPVPLKKVEEEIAGDLRHWEEHGYGWWAVEPLDGSGIIGWIGLKYIPETDETEVAGLLAKEFWGRGLAVEGAAEGLRYGFEELGLKAIVGLAHPGNARSRRVLEKLGMFYTGEKEYFGITVCRYLLRASGYAAMDMS
jgi:ribosomal-protein-alanine N-acetyltransferase